MFPTLHLANSFEFSLWLKPEFLTLVLHSRFFWTALSGVLWTESAAWAHTFVGHYTAYCACSQGYRLREALQLRHLFNFLRPGIYQTQSNTENALHTPPRRPWVHRYTEHLVGSCCLDLCGPVWPPPATWNPWAPDVCLIVHFWWTASVALGFLVNSSLNSIIIIIISVLNDWCLVIYTPIFTNIF